MRLLAAATEQTADLILITSANGGFEHANDACVHALGYTRDELSGMKLADLLERGFEQMVDHVGTRGARRRGSGAARWSTAARTARTFPASSTVVALRNRDGTVTHFVGVERDITDELRLRDQLVHSERLSAVGELVAGVAHEINNPLQTIIGCVELMLEERRADGQRARPRARAAGGGARRADRPQPARVRPPRARPIASPPTSTRSRAPRRICASTTSRSATSRCSVDLHPGVLPVLVNREEIQQVVLNLVLNAEHAIGDRPPARSSSAPTPAEHTHTLQVSDDGPGISPELRGRIFEPFFTTKEVGQGTGLGLSIALGIATAHGGSLDALRDRQRRVLRAPRSGLRGGDADRRTGRWQGRPLVTRADRRGRGADSWPPVPPAGTAGSHGRRSIVRERRHGAHRARQCGPGPV